MTRHLNISPLGRREHARATTATAVEGLDAETFRGFQLAGEPFLLTSFFIEPRGYAFEFHLARHSLDSNFSPRHFTATWLQTRISCRKWRVHVGRGLSLAGPSRCHRRLEPASAARWAERLRCRRRASPLFHAMLRVAFAYSQPASWPRNGDGFSGCFMGRRGRPGR
jgi:hypothetical protein